jgi:hypothetical protein
MTAVPTRTASTRRATQSPRRGAALGEPSATVENVGGGIGAGCGGSNDGLRPATACGRSGNAGDVAATVGSGFRRVGNCRFEGAIEGGGTWDPEGAVNVAGAGACSLGGGAC